MSASSFKSGPASFAASHTYDVFNGDADGICALHQLRLANPKDAVLITGIKRDIRLLDRVPCDNPADVTVLDISLDANVVALKRILEAGGQVSYFDHHSAKQLFEHPHLHAFLDDSSDVCTSILVNRHLQGRYWQWAAVAAFGDNLLHVGNILCRQHELNAFHTKALEELGLMLNYNAYGEKLEDLHIPPVSLYESLHEYLEPLDFVATAPQYRLLTEGYKEDESHMNNMTPEWSSAWGAIYILPCEPWARRISGVLANKLATRDAGKSFAVLTEKTDGSYLVSVRSGAPDIRSASGLCERFQGGGGRRSAAGINELPANELGRFIDSFSRYFSIHVPAVATGEAYGH
ncbi:MAG TPA: hypothetical protein VFW00_02700 [Rhodocyclaceae bacterium]|nr:hypothetical protein [Rhodocyclaceae bacterium]